MALKVAEIHQFSALKVEILINAICSEKFHFFSKNAFVLYFQLKHTWNILAFIRNVDVNICQNKIYRGPDIVQKITFYIMIIKN